MMDYLSILEVVNEMQLHGIDRVKTILALYRMGFIQDDGMTMDECAELLGCSKSRIAEIEGSALTKLTEAMV